MSCVHISQTMSQAAVAEAFSTWLILNPALFFHFRSLEVMGCWPLLRVTTPCGVCWCWPGHQSPTGAGGQPRQGQVGTVFSLYGTVWPIGKSNFYTPKGYRTLVIIFEKGLFKTEPYWKKSALTQSCASRPRTASGPLVSLTAAGSRLRRMRSGHGVSARGLSC